MDFLSLSFCIAELFNRSPRLCVKLVAGSAIQAFEEVCPERIDLIHKNFRKLVNLLIDVDEWGQVTIINMLTRYARTQFVNPLPASEYDAQAEEKKSAAKEAASEEEMGNCF